MDFALSQDEQMILESANEFASRFLRDSVREHEREGSLAQGVWAGFEAAGLGMLAEPSTDPEMELGWPIRCLALARLAAVDGPSAFALWMRDWVPQVNTLLGGSGKPQALQLVREIDTMQWPLPCLPMMGGESVLVVDMSGRWGVARVETTQVRALGMSAAGPARCELLEWEARGQAEPVLLASILAQARMWVASVLVGMSRGSMEYTHGYIQERVAFGKALAQHQGVAFMAADMSIRCEGAEMLLCRAGWGMDSGDDTVVAGC